MSLCPATTLKQSTSRHRSEHTDSCFGDARVFEPLPSNERSDGLMKALTEEPIICERFPSAIHSLAFGDLPPEMHCSH